MRILITGGCGFLGSNLAEHSAELRHTVTLFDNLSRKGSAENLEWLGSLGMDYEYINGDIREYDDVREAVERTNPDVVFHLAGQVAMTTSILNPRADFEVNVLGTINILEAVREMFPKATIIYSSTNKVYGDFSGVHCVEMETRYAYPEFPEGIPEQMPLSFHSPYGCSKGAADQYCLDYNRIYGLNTIVFRHSSMYGGRQHATIDQGWIGWFCAKALEERRALSKESFGIAGNGKQVRDLLHAEDMKTLYFAAVENVEAMAGNAYNIGGGFQNSLSLIELFSFLEAELDIRLNYISEPERISDQKLFIADISKVNAITGWTPKVGYEQGLRKMLDWVGQ